MRPEVCISLACWPGLTHVEALRRLAHPPVEPGFGTLSTAHVQLVPQNFGCLDEGLADAMRAAFPCTRFRLHANVQVLPRRIIADLAAFAEQATWFRRAAAVNRCLDGPAYTAHPGRRTQGTLQEVFDASRRCAEWFDCPVGIEAQYPSADGRWLVSTWDEYRTLFESGVPYAIDLSHVHILASITRRRELGLLNEMLACERCLEVHVSDNDGTHDQHRVCQGAPWWLPLIGVVHRDAVIFSEGNHRRAEGLA